MKNLLNQTLIVAWFASAVLLVGCEEPSGIRVNPTIGKATYKNEPMEGAEIVFYGVDETLKSAEMPVPKAIVDKNGKYRVTSFQKGDGAPAGRYNVTITWLDKRGVDQSVPLDPETADSLPDRLEGRYVDPSTSGLTAEVHEGLNEIPAFNLE